MQLFITSSVLWSLDPVYQQVLVAREKLSRCFGDVIVFLCQVFYSIFYWNCSHHLCTASASWPPALHQTSADLSLQRHWICSLDRHDFCSWLCADLRAEKLTIQIQTAGCPTTWCYCWLCSRAAAIDIWNLSLPKNISRVVAKSSLCCALSQCPDQNTTKPNK